MELELLVEVMLVVVEMEMMVMIVTMETNVVILSFQGWD